MDIKKKLVGPTGAAVMIIVVSLLIVLGLYTLFTGGLGGKDSQPDAVDSSAQSGFQQVNRYVFSEKVTLSNGGETTEVIPLNLTPTERPLLDPVTGWAQVRSAINEIGSLVGWDKVSEESELVDVQSLGGYTFWFVTKDSGVITDNPTGAKIGFFDSRGISEEDLESLSSNYRTLVPQYINGMSALTFSGLTHE